MLGGFVKRGGLTRASARRPRACDGQWDAQLSEDTKHVEPAISQRGEQRDNDDSDYDSLPALAPVIAAETSLTSESPHSPKPSDLIRVLGLARCHRAKL